MTTRSVPVFYSHAFDTTRKAAWIAESLREWPLPGIVLEAPAPLSEPDLVQVHDPEYVAALRPGQPRELAESNGLPWDSGLWSMVLASADGVVATALRALEMGGVAGSLSSGLHHAKRGHGDGFCTVNGLALAARRALAAGACGILVVDLHAHCGGGTAELLADDPRVAQVDLAVDPFAAYRDRGRFRLDLLLRAADYLPTLRRRLAETDPRSLDLVLYNAGWIPSRAARSAGAGGSPPTSSPSGKRWSLAGAGRTSCRWRSCSRGVHGPGSRGGRPRGAASPDPRGGGAPCCAGTRRPGVGNGAVSADRPRAMTSTSAAAPGAIEGPSGAAAHAFRGFCLSPPARLRRAIGPAAVSAAGPAAPRSRSPPRGAAPG